MKKHLLIISAIVSATLAASAFADDLPREAREKGAFAGGPPEKMTRAEALKRAGDQFDMVDANKDGIVTRAEMQEFREKMRPPFGMEGGPRHHDKKAQGEAKPIPPADKAR